MLIDFHDETNSVKENYIDLVQRILSFAAEKENISQNAEMSVTFVDNRSIQILNRNYRQKDEATDVISFAMQDQGEDELDIKGTDMPLILGDIVISIERAKEQADSYEHSLERELGFLALHGFLHLLGYDHINEEDEKLMFGRQEEILNAYGLER